MSLEPERYETARIAAIEDIKMHPELDHDPEVWQRFTEDIVRGMGGRGPAVAAVAEAIVLGWELHENFELYEDALRTLEAVRRAGFLLALISNTSRNLGEFVSHHDIDVDAVITSHQHGKMKPHPTIFQSVLQRLEVEPHEALMVGDSLTDDIAGADALGISSVLLDRPGAYTGEARSVRTLDEFTTLVTSASDLAT
jgi:HAD superfamily hydrolase (TIGR01549 family)